MYEVWTRAFGTVSVHGNYTDGVRALAEYAGKAGVSYEVTFSGGHFRDDEGRRYVLRGI